MVLVACGSFNPPTIMHMRMFELAAAALEKVRSSCQEGAKQEGGCKGAQVEEGRCVDADGIALQGTVDWGRKGGRGKGAIECCVMS